MLNTIHVTTPSGHPRLRPCQGALTVLNVALAGVFVAMLPYHVMADTIVSGSQGAISNSSGTQNISVTGSGTISGVANGVLNSSSGTIGTLDNVGHINVTGTGVNNSGLIGTLVNSGSISGNYSGIGNAIGATISIFNNSGTISSSSSNAVANYHGTIGVLTNSGNIHGITNGVYNQGLISTLNNIAGATISSATNGIFNDDGTIGTLSNSGLISGNDTAIVNGGSITLLSNNSSGSIVGAAIGVINATFGTIRTLSNSGVISAASTGVANYGGVIGTLNNSGLIQGASLAIYNRSTGTLGAINNSGTIAGDIKNEASANLTINGASSTAFGTLTGYSGSIGSIINLSSDVVFGTGNLLFNDNINADGHTVSNLAATLQVNNHITITGNYSQAAAATLVIGVGSGASSNGSVSDTGYGYLYVTGDAAIASGSTVALKNLNSYSFAQGQRYVVVVTRGTATYNASVLNYSVTGYTVTGATVVDSGNNTTNLVLTLGSAISSGTSSADSSTASTRPVSYANTVNAVSSLNGLFNYSGINSSLLNVFNAATDLKSSAAANRAGAQLSPVANAASAAQSSTASTGEVINVIGAHVDGLRLASVSGASGVATGESASNAAVWGQAFGGKANQGLRDNVSGYESNYKGLLLGADSLVSERWRLGGLVSYANTGLSNTGDNTGSSANVDSYGLMAYSGYTAERYYVDFSAGAVAHRYSTVRAIDFTGVSATASGKFNGLQYVTSLRSGYPIRLDNMAPGTVLTPLAGLTYSNLHQNGYTETGGSGTALNVNAATSSSLKSELGAKLERSFSSSYGEISPSIQLGWRHEFHDHAQQLTASYVNDSSGATSFTTQGASGISDTGVMALALTLSRSKNLSLSARYTLEAASGFTAQTADVRLRYQF